LAAPSPVGLAPFGVFVEAGALVCRTGAAARAGGAPSAETASAAAAMKTPVRRDRM
jgi:hypothetical protein